MTDKEQHSGPRDAIGKILEILEPLPAADSKKVLSAVHAFLGILAETPQPVAQAPAGPVVEAAESSTRPQAAPAQRDIRTLREEKNPTSDIEMATLMAYYLQELAPPSQRKDVVSAADVNIYFKQADAELPKRIRQTLLNAKNAGYLDSVGRGRFRLNAVGYNLVAHSLPKSGVAGKPKLKRKRSSAAEIRKKSKT